MIGDLCVFRYDTESYSGPFVWEMNRIVKQGTVGIHIENGFSRHRVLTAEGAVWVPKRHVRDDT